MTILWTEYLPKVQLEVPMVPQPVLIDAIRESAIEFCKLSQAWRETLESVVVTPDTIDIELEGPDSSLVHSIISASFGTTELEPMTHGQLDAKFDKWNQDGQPTGESVAITLLNDDLVRLIPHPSTEGELTMRALLVPAQDSLGAPDFLWQRHYDCIAKGAKAMLMEVTGVPWSNPGRAAQLKKQFEDNARSVRVRIDRAYTKARFRTGFHYR